jgi:hypothetical protein
MRATATALRQVREPVLIWVWWCTKENCEGWFTTAIGSGETARFAAVHDHPAHGQLAIKWFVARFEIDGARQAVDFVRNLGLIRLCGDQICQRIGRGRGNGGGFSLRAHRGSNGGVESVWACTGVFSCAAAPEPAAL